SKYVRYVDVQYEIVDHLACDIESLMSEDSKLTFDQALTKTYSKYPISGFSNLKTAKEKEMHHYWMRVFRKFLFEYFKLPKIFLTVLIGWTFFQLFKTFGNPAVMIVFISLTIVYLYQAFKQIKLMKREVIEKYLVLHSYNSIHAAFGGMGSYIVIQLIFNSQEINFPSLIVLSVLASINLILIPVLYKSFPEYLKKELETKYQHLNIEIA
ncbi:MAG: hypothetical protein HKN51_03080, partial [Saprospiraceae bacterium]|nr:hypothetical protein [Saprospiraceae bacterium]